MIFDECHRSHFGDSHKNIMKFFTNTQIFGFTGTPIFVENSIDAGATKVNQENRIKLMLSVAREKNISHA